MGLELVATDLDGTFLSAGSLELTRKATSALEKLNKRGIVFVVATGRALSTVPRAIRKTPALSYLVCSNGAKIFTAFDEKVIYKKTVSKKAVELALPILKNPKIELEVFVDDTPFVSDDFFYGNASFGRSERFLSYFKETRKPIGDIFELIEKNENDIENINLIFGDDNLKQQTLEQLKEIEKKENSFEVSQSLTFNLEIGGKNVSKGEAIKIICEREKIDIKNVFAAGDNINDLSMLSIAGISAAIENSPVSSLMKFTHIVPPPEEDGVAQLIDQLIDELTND